MGGLKQDYWQNYVDGNWVDGGAVKAALACHESGVLSSMRLVERGRMVRGMGDYLLANREEIAEMVALESGKPCWEALVETDGAASYFEV